MASYTENYALTKPTMAESADIRVINGNMDTVDDVMHSTQISLAPAYDASETYNTGDVVMYELLMYECLEDDVTGAWDATKWQRTTAGEHGGGSDVEVTQIQTEGKAVASIAVDGVITNILIPELKVYGEATGDLITIEDAMEAPLEECKVTLEPQQDLSQGDPSPTNICPISGWSAVNVTRRGVNLWGGEKLADDIVAKVPQATKDTTNKTVTYYASQVSEKPLFNGFKENTQYTIYLSTTSTYTNIDILYSDGTYDGIEPNTYKVTNANKTVSEIEGLWASGTTVLKYDECGVFEGVSTAQDFEPYNGQTYTIQLGGTYYGGVVDVVNGIMTVDRIGIKGVNVARVSATGSGVKYADTTIMYTDLVQNTTTISDRYVQINTSTIGVSGRFRVYNGQFTIYDDRFTDLATAQSLLNDVEFCYELATPQTIQLTPTQITTLLGNNNPWSDGEMYVKWRRDIEILLQRIADSLGGSNA